jgi:DNA repair protein RecN (Recombination protein N)
VLRDLHVQNLAVIVEADIQLGDGLNVLTGETGAGKSIVVDSLALLSGVRASGDLIRTGADTLSVTGIFEPGGEGWRPVLVAAGLDVEGDEVVVRREISRQGRNRVFVNDQPVTLNLLAALAPHLIQIHTQREELRLVSPELQRSWLDRSGGTESTELCRQVSRRFEEYQELASRLDQVEGNERLRQERIDLLRFQQDEIDAARLQPGEDEALEEERDVLRHSEAITAALGSSYGLLFEDDEAAVEKISRAARRLHEISEWEPRGARWSQGLEALLVGLEDLALELRDRLPEIDADPGRLDAIEERLSLIDRLTRKYGETCAAVLEYRQRIARELDDLTADVTRREELAKQAGEALAEFERVAGRLSSHRREWGTGLVERVHRELADLALGKARFAVALNTRSREGSPVRVEGAPVEFSVHGYDQITYQLAANPGEDLAPLSRSASGGELSRIYLAVQLAIRAGGEAARSTLVFDEVDAGIGGAQAEALGQKLARLAVGGQILVVTHLPQVASQADHHFRVEKRAAGNRTLTRVVSLESESRVEEVARMLGGKKITDLTRSHAAEMIATAAGMRR